MEDVKSILQSKAVWGSLLVIVAMALRLGGVDLGDADGFANDIVAAIGGILALYGRIVAVKKIG